MRKLGMASALLTGLFLVGCGTSTHGPSGSMNQTKTGVSETGYPGHPAQRTDPQSPALSSSTEATNSQAISEPTAPGTEARAETKTEAK